MQPGSPYGEPGTSAGVSGAIKAGSGSGHAIDWLTVIARWALGGLFIYMGLKKALDPVGFLKLVRQYEIVNDPLLLNLIAASLPWFEIFCGALLALGVAVRGAALVSLAMLVPFTVIVLNRALEIAHTKSLAFCAVRFDCGCGAGEVYICHKLVENCALILISLWLLRGRGRQFSTWFGLDWARPCSARDR